MASFHTCFVMINTASDKLGPMIYPIRAVASASARDALRDKLKDVPNVVEVTPGECFVISDAPKDPDAVARAVANDKADRNHETSEYNERTERTRINMFDHMTEHRLAEKDTCEWNKLRWVKYKKRLAGIADDDMVHQGTTILKSSNDDEDADILGTNSAQVLPPGPPANIVKEQYIVVILSPDSDDRSKPQEEGSRVEPAVRVLGVFPTQKEAEEYTEEEEEDVGARAYCVARTGGWLDVLQPIWAQSEVDTSYNDKTMDRMMHDRKHRFDENARARVDIKKQSAESHSRACAYAEKLGMRVDDVLKIAENPKGKEELLEAARIQDLCCLEDAVDDIKERYLGIPVPN
jgi:hypothetical protein